jgi:hypothetical protein
MACLTLLERSSVHTQAVDGALMAGAGPQPGTQISCRSPDSRSVAGRYRRGQSIAVEKLNEKIKCTETVVCIK